MTEDRLVVMFKYIEKFICIIMLIKNDEISTQYLHYQINLLQKIRYKKT